MANTAPSRTTTYAWYLAALLALAYLLNIVDRFLMALLVEDIKSSLQLTDTQIGILQGPSFVALFVLASLPMGWLADVWNRRALVASGVLVWSLATFACGLADSFGGLLTARLLVGLGEATLMPCAMSLIVASFSRDRLNRGISIYSMGGSLGRFVAFSGGGALLGWFASSGGLVLPVLGVRESWQSLFVVAGVAGVAVAALLWLTIREPLRTASIRFHFAAVRDAMGYFRRNLRAYLAISMPFAMVTAITMQLAAWTVSFYMRQHQLSAPAAGQLVGLTGLIFGPAGHLLGGWLNDKLTSRGLRGAQVWVLIGILAIVPFLVAVFLRASDVPVAAVAYGFSYLGLCIAGPTGFGGVQRITPDRMRGFMSSVFLVIYMTLGSGVGPLAAGVINDYYFRDGTSLGQSILAGTAVFMVIGLWFAIAGRHAYARVAQQNESQNA